MRRWADQKGGFAAMPDGFDRSNAFTLASLIDAWFRRLEERAYSLETIEARKWALRTFLQWAEARDLRRPDQITKPILESYQRYLFQYRKGDGKPLGVTTQRGRLGAVQNFFTWLCRENTLLANPAADLELPRKPNKTLPKSLSLDEVHAVLNVPDVTDPLGVRDRTILEVLYATGIRRAECVRLDVDDLDRDRGLITVRKGKGNKDRVVPVGERALNWLTQYLEKTRPLLSTAQSGRALFISGYGDRISPGYLGNWVRRIIAAANIGRQGSFSSCSVTPGSTPRRYTPTSASFNSVKFTPAPIRMLACVQMQPQRLPPLWNHAETPLKSFILAALPTCSAPAEGLSFLHG
jgi:integrase/recombinase XerD